MFGLAKPMFGARPTSAAAGRLAAAARLQHRHRQGQGSCWRRPAMPNGFETTLSFDLGLGVDQRAALRADSGEPGADRHQGDASTRSRARTGAARWSKKELPLIVNFFSGWLDYPGVLLLLVLSRPERRLQHDELPGQGHGRADRRRAQGGGRRRRGGLREERQGLRRQGVRRGAAHPAVPALPERRDAEEHLRLPLLVPPPARLPLARARRERSKPAMSARRRTRSDRCNGERMLWNVAQRAGRP